MPLNNNTKLRFKIAWFWYHYQIISVLPKGRSSTASAGTKATILPKAGLPQQTEEPRLQFYQELKRCGSFPLLFAPHSLFSIRTDLKRSEKISGAPKWRWGEWIWLTGPSRLHRNSPQGLNISSIRFLTRSEIRKSQSRFAPDFDTLPNISNKCLPYFHM